MAALRPCLMVMGTIGALALLFPHVIFGLFVADHAVAAAGELAMRVSILTLSRLGVRLHLQRRAAWRGRHQVPGRRARRRHLGLAHPDGDPADSAAWRCPARASAMALDFWVQAGLSYWRFRSGKWRTAKV